MAVERMPLVVIDVFERRCGVVEPLRELGTHLELERLAGGDYAIGSEVLVERKTVGDLHASLVKGRFWSQIGAVREACRYPHLLVEGTNLDGGPVSPSAIRSTCLAVMRLGVRLLRTTEAVDSATVRGIGRKRAQSSATVTTNRADAGNHAVSRSQPCCERPGPST